MSYALPFWNQLLLQGLDFLEEKEYEDAFDCFDRAIMLNDEEQQLYELRSTALEKMEKYEEALEDAEHVINLDPKSWEGYARLARLFHLMDKPKDVLKMVNKAFECTNYADRESYLELDKLRWINGGKVESGVFRFKYFPVEIILRIFKAIAVESDADMMQLGAVCQSWRKHIIGMPEYWGRITVSKNSTKQQVETWLTRSRKQLDTIHLTYTADLASFSKVFRGVRTTFWANLRVLELDRENQINKPLDLGIPEKVFKCLSNLRVLRIKIRVKIDQNPNVNLPRLLHSSKLKDASPDLSMLEELSFLGYNAPNAFHYNRLVKLKRLSIFEKNSLESIGAILSSIPHPENLVQLALYRMKYSTSRVRLDLDTSVLAPFVRLTHLDISGYNLTGRWSTLMTLPLENLSLAFGSDRMRDDYGKEIEWNELQLKSLSFREFRLAYNSLAATLEAARKLMRLRMISSLKEFHLSGSSHSNICCQHELSVLRLLARTEDPVCPGLCTLYWFDAHPEVTLNDLRIIVNARTLPEPQYPTPTPAQKEGFEYLEFDRFETFWFGYMTPERFDLDTLFHLPEADAVGILTNGQGPSNSDSVSQFTEKKKKSQFKIEIDNCRDVIPEGFRWLHDKESLYDYNYSEASRIKKVNLYVVRAPDTNL